MDRTSALKEFGALIRDARSRAGKTQLSLGVELGFANGQFISNLERGLRPLPPKHIPGIARAIGFDQDDLMARLLAIHKLRIRERSEGK